MLNFEEFKNFLTKPSTRSEKERDLNDERIKFIISKLNDEIFMNHITKNNKLILKPASRNNALVSASIKLDAGVAKKRGLGVLAYHQKGTPPVNAIKKQYKINVTKAFIVIIVYLADEATAEEVNDLIKWLNSVKIDKQIQQITAVQSQIDDKKALTITIICAMTSTVVVASVFSSFNIKHFNLDCYLDNSISPPSLSLDASALISNGWVGLYKEPDFQSLLPLVKLLENANISLKFASVQDFIQSGKLDGLLQELHLTYQLEEILKSILTSTKHDTFIESMTTKLIEFLLSMESNLSAGFEYTNIIKRTHHILVCNPDNVLSVAFTY